MNQRRQNKSLSGERYCHSSLKVREADNSTDYQLPTYSTNSKGERFKIINSGKNYDSQKRNCFEGKPLSPCHNSRYLYCHCLSPEKVNDYE